jgi:RNA polymerase sigma factor (sigma-70 family)
MEASLPHPSSPLTPPLGPSLTADLLQRHGPFVRALAHELLADEHAADDTVQETWLRFLAHPPRAAAATRTWLRSVTTRLTIERRRGAARRAEREERSARPEALPSVAEELAQAEVARSLVAAVLALEEPYRTSVLLAHWRGWDARRIARETGAPLATVRSRLQRAHGKLRERLDASHGRAAWAAVLARLPGAKSAGAAWLAGIGAGLVAVVGVLLFLPREPASAPRTVSEPAPAVVAAARATELPPQEPAARTSLGTTPVSSGTVRVAGTVVDRAAPELALPARPSAGLVVKAKLSGSSFGQPVLVQGEARTDAEGRFELALARPEQAPLWLHVWAPEDDDYRLLWHHEELAQTEVELELALARSPRGVLGGTVVDESGSPLGGMALEIGGVAVTSAADGAFTIARAKGSTPVRLLTPGRSLLGLEPAHEREEGGFTPMRVHVGPAAALRLRVLDRAGRGIEGVTVTAGLPEGELAVLGLEEGDRRSGKTDGQGEVQLEGLWAARRLRISLMTANETLLTDARAGERLVLDGAAGVPIVAAAGETLTLEARIAEERALAGHVRLPGGRPAVHARVAVTDLGREGDVMLALETDAEGRFAGTLRASRLRGPLVIEASLEEAPPERGELRGLGYAGPSMPSQAASDGLFARVEHAAGDTDGLAALALELEPRHSIEGFVRTKDGAPFDGLARGSSRLWAVPAGADLRDPGRPAAAFEDPPGRFVVHGLAAGAWDLVVSEELERGYSFESFLTRLADVPAGEHGVELRLAERREVRVRVRLRGPAAGWSVALHRKLFPRSGFAAPNAEKTQLVQGAGGWPEGAALGFSGIGGRTTAEWRASDGFDVFEGAELELQPFEPGFYAIGLHVMGLNAGGGGGEGASACFPQATPVQWFEAGEYVIEFEPVPAVALRGHVLGDASGEFLAVALADERGELLPLAPLSGFTHAARVLDTGAGGEFVLPAAPVGAWRLRVGSRAELERGGFRRELALTLVPGANAPLEIRL